MEKIQIARKKDEVYIEQSCSFRSSNLLPRSLARLSALKIYLEINARGMAGIFHAYTRNVINSSLSAK